MINDLPFQHPSGAKTMHIREQQKSCPLQWVPFHMVGRTMGCMPISQVL